MPSKQSRTEVQDKKRLLSLLNGQEMFESPNTLQVKYFHSFTLLNIYYYIRSTSTQGKSSYIFIKQSVSQYYYQGSCKSRTYHLSNDASQFGTTVLPAIYIAWIIKYIVKRMHNIISESHTNNNSNDQNSEWLTEYWEKSEKENIPETSSSQEERIPKKIEELLIENLHLSFLFSCTYYV